MSELPELPIPPRRSRPLPAGGLQAAVETGRRRRQRALGAAGGGGVALTLLLAAVLTLPDSGGQDSLQVARTPEAVPTASAAPRDGDASPGPEASTGPADAASPEPSQDDTDPSLPGISGPGLPGPGGTLPGPFRSPAPGPAATGGAQPAPGGGPVDSRPAYVEDTDEDAEGGCAAGTTRGCTYASGGRDVVRRGMQAQVVFGTCVAADDIGDRVYSFGGGQEKDVFVVPEDNVSQEIYRFSSTVRYVQGPHERRARRGKCLQWTGRWDLVTTDGRPVPAGTYIVSMRVRADRQVYENGPDDQSGPFDETISTRITVVD